MCAGKEFRLRLSSMFRTVMFTPDSGEPKRVLLENTSVSEFLHLLVLFFVDSFISCTAFDYLKLLDFMTAGQRPTV